MSSRFLVRHKLVAAFAALQRDDPLFTALLLIGERDSPVLVLLERGDRAALEIRIAVEQIIGVVLLEIDELVEILFVSSSATPKYSCKKASISVLCVLMG